MKLTAILDGDTIKVHQEGGYSPENKVALRSISTGARCKGGCYWSYPFSQGAIDALVEMASLINADLSLDDYLEQISTGSKDIFKKELEVRKAIQRYMDNTKLVPAPYVTRNDPVPWRHQQIAWHWGMRVDALYIAHKPGLGKTREGTDLIRGRIDMGSIRPPESIILPEREALSTPGKILPPRYGIKGGVLVVCPKVVIGTWYSELARWQQIQSQVVSGGVERKRRAAGTLAWVHLCNYGSLESIEGNEYDAIVADELHYVANEDSKRFQRMIELRKHARWVLGMSGTPLSNMLQSLWSQYYWLDGGRTLGSSLAAFKKKYYTGNWRDDAEKENATANVAKRVSRVTYFLTMQEAFPDKKQKIQQVIHVPMTPEQLKYYEQLRKRDEADVHTGTVSMVEMNTRLMKLLQVAQGFVIDDKRNVRQFTSAKLNALKDMITGSGDLTDKRVIVWCRFRHDLEMICKMLHDHQVAYLTLHGDLKEAEKEASKDAWNNDHRWRVLVGMIQMGIGINLHAPKCVDFNGNPERCSTTVFFGLDWRVTQLEQAMDRVYRGDQVETCLYRYLISADVDGMTDEKGEQIPVIDQRVYDTLMLKLEQSTELSEESLEYVKRLVAA
jgi:SNF2 family DNA or RNA helicase